MSKPPNGQARRPAAGAQARANPPATAPTQDFGAPTDLGAHLFRVQIPPDRRGAVTITEDYGYRGLEGGIPQAEDRVVLPRPAWTALADTARREFNDRLKAARLTTGRWHPGPNLVDRLLGKELCVLAWAAETATPEQWPIICSKWAALRPEERWWLFAMTVAEAGLPGDTQRGWRRALFHALADGAPAGAQGKRPRPTEPELITLPLFAELSPDQAP